MRIGITGDQGLRTACLDRGGRVRSVRTIEAFVELHPFVRDGITPERPK